MKRLCLAEIAEMVDGELSGDGSIEIRNLTSIDLADSSDLCFLVNIKEVNRIKETGAGAVLVPANFEESVSVPVIKVRDPYLASAIVHNALLEEEFAAQGVHTRAFVGEECTIPEAVTVGPLAVIGNRVRLGQRVKIESGVVIGDDVAIGDDCCIKANVTIANQSLLGDRVTIHSGTVIGSDGYGYATDSMGNHVKRPQVGRVRIDNDVEIGANVCIDRAAFGETWIQSGTKIDNLVQIAHNVEIGPNSLIVAQVGIAGSTTLGRNVVLGGQVAVNGHIKLEDQVMVAATSGVHTNLAKGEKVGGSPAMPIRKWAKACSVYARLPEFYSEFRKMKKTVSEIQESQDK